VIHKTATFQVRRAGLERSLAAIREFIAYVAANEPGTLHSSSTAVERFTKVLYPECLAPVVFTDFAIAASTEPQR
jgi:hypothetical protein